MLQSQADLVSLYVFGEDEETLSSDAQKNGGIVKYDKVAKYVENNPKVRCVPHTYYVYPIPYSEKHHG